MKKVGLIGGIGPASTLDYYLGIIDGCRQRASGEDYPEIIIYSINMTEMLSLIENERWDEVVVWLTQITERLSAAGADFAAMASNTPHLVYDEVNERSPIPIVSIVEETCRFVKEARYQRPLTIGTLFTMKNRLYADPLKKHGITSVLPSENEQREIHSLFFPNLENGIVVPEDKEKMLALIKRMIREQDADSVILGCTELPLMITENDLEVPIIDTVRVHIRSIVDRMTE
ncbi:MAG: amino acid racemase [Candidatus Methanoplasma sp.]|jgi:aspartate racemase|nr:amino acid racemase [Candidatus Methanoplasma sp.]